MLELQASLQTQTAYLEVTQAEERIDGHTLQGSGIFARDLLDVHAALCGEDQQRPSGAALQDDRQVVLGGDLDRLLQEHGDDRLAGDRHRQNLCGGGVQLVWVSARAARRPPCRDHRSAPGP